MQLEKHQLLFLFRTKHRGSEPSSHCQVPLIHTQTWIPHSRILNVSNFREMNSFHLLDSDKEGKEKLISFLCLSPFPINIHFTVFMFSISLSKTDCWSVHLLPETDMKLKNNTIFSFIQSSQNWWPKTLSLRYHWILFWLEHFNNNRYWDSYNQWIFINAKSLSNSL